jgi:hypothetical protein
MRAGVQYFGPLRISKVPRIHVSLSKKFTQHHPLCNVLEPLIQPIVNSAKSESMSPCLAAMKCQ